METRKLKKMCADMETIAPGADELGTLTELKTFSDDDLEAVGGLPQATEMEQLPDLLELHTRQQDEKWRQILQDRLHFQREVQQGHIQQTERPLRIF